MHAGLLDMLHHTADESHLTITQAVHITLNGVVEEPVEQHGRIVAHLDGLAHVALEVALLVHDFHRTATQHVARTHHQRIPQRCSFFQRLGLGTGGGVGRLAQTQLVQQFLETLTVFGCIDHVRAGPDDGHALGMQPQRQLQRGLAAVLHDDASRLFLVDDFQHVFECERFEVQAVAGVVVGGHGLGVAVDHDGLVAVLAHGQRCVHTAVVKLDALADAVRSAT